MLTTTQPKYTRTDFPRTLRIRPPKRRFVYLVATLVVAYLVFARFSADTTDTLSPLPDAGTGKQKSSVFSQKKDPDDLKQKITTLIGNSWLNYSVIVELYNEPFTLSISETEIYTAASVNKVPILAALYYYARQGTIDLDRTITLQKADIQDYGTGTLRYASPGSTYSIKTLARLMIKHSDNTAAYILGTHVIGLENIQTLLTQWGLTQTDMVQNKTSNADMSLLFRLMYGEKVTDHAYTQEMLSYLKDTDFETRLPAQLPQGVRTYHKIGTEVGIVHDAGLVTDGAITYYIGIFTRDTSEGTETDQLMARVSKEVYDYLH